MCQINIYEAKTQLSKYLSLLQSGAEEEVIICNNGIPCGKLTKVEPQKQGGLIFGLAEKEAAEIKDNQFSDQEIAEDFEEELSESW